MNPLARILDANANRAREALRVMEDVARFGLDDARLTEDLKRLRHGLRSSLDQPALDSGLLLAARDTAHDQGRTIKTPAEGIRGNLGDIAAAAAARLTEALRAIEESAKALGADPVPIETLRYDSYTLGQRLLLALPTGRCRQWRLCVLITESLCRRPWLEVARAALAGGADVIQLREKELDGGELLMRARALIDLARRSRGTNGERPAIVVNDRPDAALAAGADGVHLGQTDLPIADVRRQVGFRLLIGASTATMDQARAAVRAGADYCGVGPTFATTTKDKPLLSGPAYLREYLADAITSQRPHLAIGGITPENVQVLREAGCRGIAVSAAVCGAEDPAAACQALLDGLGAPTPG
jgi:thiamine-phosphate pyrophosphorylase